MTKVALSISLLAAAMTMVGAAPHNPSVDIKNFNAGHNVASVNENKLVDAEDLFLGVDVLKRTDTSVCKKYISTYNGGHNVYSFNKNTLVDLSDATIDLEVLSGDGRRRFYKNVPKYCATYIKQVEGGHNTVSINENSVLDASGLAALVDVLKRDEEVARSFTYESYDAGHNVVSDNENKAVDASGLTLGVDVLRRKAPSFSKLHYNGGHNVKSSNQNKLIDCDGCGGTYRLLRHVSFVDCPGHDILMSTMLSGAAVMDAALLLIAGNETCPQPQTSEHLAAIEIMKLNHIIILQNKVDLMREEGAEQHYQSILKFIRGTVADGSPIIPISAQLKFNIDAVNEYLVTKIPVPVRDFTAKPHMIVIRSFDVNKPGAEIEELKGGVAGGSILTGVLKLGDEVEIRPGIVTKDEQGKIQAKPIYSRVVSLFAEHNDLKFAVPGGLIGVGTRVDPTLCRADRLVGFVLGLRGHLPAIYTELEVNYFLLRRLLGVKTADGKQAKVAKLAKNEVLMVNIGSTATGAKVVAVKADAARLTLTSPACTEIGEKVALSRRIEKHWRLIGWANIVAGTTLTPTSE